MRFFFQVSSRILFGALLLATTLSPARGQEEAELAIPKPYPASRYQTEWKNSAFHREVVAQVVRQKIAPSFARSLQLEGLVMDSHGPIAYVRDTSKNSPLVITKAKSTQHPFQIVESILKPNPAQTSVIISNGEKTAELRYGAGMLSQPIKSSRPATKPGSKSGKRPSAQSGNGAAKPKSTPPPKSTKPAGSTQNKSGNDGKPPHPTPTGRRRVVLPKG